jgi:eukaryotic-like serine/threonine-protein kinase
MASPESGQRLADRYVLLQRLGDGGHAEVWAARDESDGQQVALKFLHQRSCSADEAWRVLRHEAQMAQRLDHPGVLRVNEPQRDGAVVFLPIEYAGGGDATRLRGASWQQVLPVLLQVAQVLEHAHSRGVVHRDIKPRNVLFNAAGSVRIADFGAASRTGSTAALAAGSPFSASPQQLRGDAATTADDVYGLGALAYELLTRHPPYYPDFDSQRMLLQDAPRPVPVQLAPPALLDLIQAMVARDAAARPDLQQVMQVFEQWLAHAAATPAADEALLIEPAPAAAAPPRERRQIAAGWWLAAAAVIASVAFVLVPRAPATTREQAAAPIAAPAKPVTLAVVAIEGKVEAVPAVAATPVATSIAQALQAGRAALAAEQPALARAAFQRALGFDAANAEATRGLDAAVRLAALLEGYVAATRAEAQGDLRAAQTRYQALLAQDGSFAPARAALLRVQDRQRADQLEGLLSQGVSALRLGQLPAAQSAYVRAAAINANDPRVRDGQARVAEILRSQRNADDLASGVALERGEHWDQAVTHYQAVLARDASLLFAQDGLTRSSRRAALDHELQDYLTRPERLSAAAVNAAAARAIVRAEASSGQQPRLGEQVKALRAQLQLLATQVPVAITSDNTTVVTVAQLGELGAFRLRELELPPGRYTVIGRRDGFRDVRLELDITPGQQRAAVSVQCTERI